MVTERLPLLWCCTYNVLPLDGDRRIQIMQPMRDSRSTQDDTGAHKYKKWLKLTHSVFVVWQSCRCLTSHLHLCLPHYYVSSPVQCYILSSVLSLTYFLRKSKLFPSPDMIINPSKQLDEYYFTSWFIVNKDMSILKGAVQQLCCLWYMMIPDDSIISSLQFIFLGSTKL